MEILKHDGLDLATNVLVKAGQSWFSQQVELPQPRAGVSYELRLVQVGPEALTGNAYPRGGNRKRHERAGEVVLTTATPALGGDRLPLVPGIDSADLVDLSTSDPETLVNVGNLNTNFAELEIRVLTGQVRVSVIAGSKQG